MTPGRNQPCLCGSDKKFKRCCLPLYRLQRETQRILFCKNCSAPARIITRGSPVQDVKRAPGKLTLIRGLCSTCWNANPTVNLPNGTYYMGSSRCIVSSR